MRIAQSSTEYVFVYGAVLFAVILALVALFALGIFSFGSTLANTATGFTGFGVSQLCLPGGSFIVNIANEQGTPLEITQLNLTLSNGTTLNSDSTAILPASTSETFFILNACPASSSKTYDDAMYIGYLTGSPANTGPFSSYGTITGTSVGTFTLPGVAEFNGQESVVEDNASGLLSPEYNVPAFAIVAWVQLSSYPLPGFNSTIYSAGYPTQNLDFYIKAGGDLCIETYNSFYSGKTVNRCSTTPVPLNKWVLVAATLSSGSPDGGTFAIYINTTKSSAGGNEEQNTNHPSTYLAVGANIGSQFGGSQAFSGFDGNISNLQIYRVAVPASQIAQLYSEGTGASPLLNDSIELWMPFVGSANDFSGHFYDGSAEDINFIP